MVVRLAAWPAKPREESQLAPDRLACRARRPRRHGAVRRSPGGVVTYVVSDNQLGDEVLAAGVYRFGGASTANLIGNLELAGSADDIWIFQTTSTLVTAASSTITFSGGAQACNVFWQVGTAATLGASSSFAGTILAHDAITLGSQVTVNGRRWPAPSPRTRAPSP